MPRNNNVSQNAVVRLTKLPMVRSACATLSVLYLDTKRSHPSLKSVCEVLENGVTSIGSVAYDRVSPVIIKLEPQISIVNDVACKGLDWLETAFPVLQQPTEKIAASAKNKMLEVKDLASIAGTGTVDCVQHAITWVTGRMADDDEVDQSLVKKAISVASLGLDSALSVTETLMDQLLPPTKEDREEEAKTVKGFEAATGGTSYPVRLVSLTVKLCRGTCHKVGATMHTVKDKLGVMVVWKDCRAHVKQQMEEVMESLPSSAVLVQLLQTSWLTLAWSLHGLPQHLQHRAVCLLFFVSQMYNLSCPISPQDLPDRVRGSLSAALAYLAPNSPLNNMPPVQPQARSNGRMRRPAKTSGFGNGRNAKGYAHR
ncbi:perilipin-2-like [Centroberyx affinis]|uniref:perilipin-2-like n=1 Tax=Centroberyx affinis TaxID=166261 RepID=UPI003A5BCA1E